MKLFICRSRQRGTALIIVMALLAVMCVFMLCASQSVTFVKRELKLIEKNQLERCAQGLTNAPKPNP